jgi:hypothetical protein
LKSFGSALFESSLTFVRHEFEALKQIVHTRLSPGWCLITLAGAGVPFLSVMDSHNHFTESNRRVSLGGSDTDSEIESISAVLELLEYWISVASSRAAGDRQSGALMELRNVRFERHAATIKDFIRTIPRASSLLNRLQLIERSRNNII